MRMILMRENTWRFTDPQVYDEIRSGEADDISQGRIRALATIGLSLRDEIFPIIADCTDPRDAWVRLQNYFQSGNNASRLMLKDKLNSIRLLEGASVSEYLRQIQEVRVELAGIGHVASEEEIVERMLNSLPPSFDAIYQSFCNSEDLPTFDQVAARLLQDESRNNMRAKVTASAKEEALALRFTNRNTNSNFRLGNTSHQSSMFRNDTTGGPGGFRTDHNGSRRVQVGPCNWCGRMNHLMRNCRELANEVTKRIRER